jgi:methyl-accepting chemotaxis protein
MSIGKRLSWGFFILILLVATMAGAGVYALHQMRSAVDFLVDHNVMMERTALGWNGSTTTHESLMYAFAMASKPDDLKYFSSLLQRELKDVETTIEVLKKKSISEEGKRILHDALEKRAAYSSAVGEVYKLNGVSPFGEIVGPAAEYATMKPLLEGKLIPAATTYQKAVAAVGNFHVSRAAMRLEGVRSLHQIAQMTLGALTLVIVLIAVILGWRLTVGITRPLGDALQVATTISQGDLTSRIEIRSGDEVGRLMGAMKAMNEYLLGTVSNVRSSAETIATASSEIAAGTMDLSSRTEEQASSLQETASSMEELTSTVRQNGDNARQANQLASQAASIAIQGGEAARKVADTMSEIDASANKIVDIISVIDGIAFQTNILALNAAVEAARAGEQGRGFAVVATEVRSLAQRSATAAKEIKDLIGDSVNRIRAGSDLVQQSTTTMLEVGESIRKVNDIMGEISAATQEQVSGIEQVNEAVSQMDTVSQQNAALVEQSAAASESLQDQARALVQVVSMFKTGNASLPPPASSPGARRAGAPVAVKKLAPPSASASAPQRPAAQKSSGAAPANAGDDDGDWEEF